MAAYTENGSQRIQPLMNAQSSIMDIVLFPGFTRMSAAVQEHLMVDLNLYLPLLCILALLIFTCRRICENLLGWFETYFTSTVHVRPHDEAYDMLIMWMSAQSFTKHARSSLATTDLNSAVTQFARSDRDAKPKTVYYTPWNGRFFIRYHGRLLTFRRQYRAGEHAYREEASISCFSRSPQILRKLLTECLIEYSKLAQGKTSLYKHKDDTWARSVVSDIRHILTVILNESRKRELLKDIGDFLDQAARRWYSNRGIPYRRGYLLYGSPGTGKSSLSLSIAGHFGLDICILSLSTITEDSLSNLFSKLPSRCVILLEDNDAASSNRSRDTEVGGSRPGVTGSLSQQTVSERGKVSLSALLNVIDGVASQEGRVLIMTTNHITRLDEALIRPGRVDKKAELGLADMQMMADLFYVVFRSFEGDAVLTKDDQLNVRARSGGKTNVNGAVRRQEEEVMRVEQLAKDFAAKVPELIFSPAEILSFLLEYRQSPREAIDNVEMWMTGIVEGRREAKNGV